MRLEVHDKEEGNSLAGQVSVDYDYQAEMWVQQLITDEKNNTTRRYSLDKFVLVDHEGKRAEWVVDGESVSLTWKSPRFTGEWQLNLPYPTPEIEK